MTRCEHRQGADDGRGTAHGEQLRQAAGTARQALGGGFGGRPSSSPSGLRFADDGHILFGYFPSDIDSFTLPNFRLGVIGRYVYYPAIIRGSAIVVAFRRHGGDRKANHKSHHKKVLSHWPEAFLGQTASAHAD